MPFRIPLTALLIAMTATITGCAGDPSGKPAWVADSSVDIPAFETFGWEGGSGTAPVTVIDNQIRDTIRASLLAKGYAESDTDADFLLSHETIERDAIKQGNPVRIGIGVGSWGGNVGGSVGTSVDVGEKDAIVQQLQIAIRALNSSAEREVWAGTSAALPAQPDPESVKQAVLELMAGFPEKRNGPTP